MKTLLPVKIGQLFKAQIRKHKHSMNISGTKDYAGRMLQETFTCTRVSPGWVHAGDRKFATEMFNIFT